VSITAGKLLELRLGGEGTNARVSESTVFTTMLECNSIVSTGFFCLPLAVPLCHSFLVFGCQTVAEPRLGWGGAFGTDLVFFLVDLRFEGHKLGYQLFKGVIS
jgi:hypothetical protein